MKLLLDTQTLLWFVWNHPKLSVVAQGLIADPANDLYFSAASYWEIAIKVSIGKLPLTDPFDVFINRVIADNDLSILPIGLDHANKVITLPFHHRDPFDRMLAAQSLVEGVSFVSVDSVFDAYGVNRLW